MVECKLVLHMNTIVESDLDSFVIDTATGELWVNFPILPRVDDVLYLPYEYDEDGEPTRYLSPTVKTVKTIIHRKPRTRVDYVIELRGPNRPVSPSEFELGILAWRACGFYVEENSYES